MAAVWRATARPASQDGGRARPPLSGAARRDRGQDARARCGDDRPCHRALAAGQLPRQAGVWAVAMPTVEEVHHLEAQLTLVLGIASGMAMRLGPEGVTYLQ